MPQVADAVKPGRLHLSRPAGRWPRQNKFITLAETSGLVVPLGHWVLREACAAWLALKQASHPMPLSINVSPLQFRQPPFHQPPFHAGLSVSPAHAAGAGHFAPRQRLIRSSRECANGKFRRQRVRTTWPRSSAPSSWPDTAIDLLLRCTRAALHRALPPDDRNARPD